MITVNRVLLLCIISISVLIAGCSQNETPTVVVSDVQVTVNPGINNEMEPYVFATSSPGTVTLHGRMWVLDPTSMLPDPNDAVYLVPLAVTDGAPATIPPFTVGEVPQAEVDERIGEFTFTNIEPGDYAIVVLTMGGAQVPSRFYGSGSLAILKIEESDLDTIIELEDLSLP